MSTLASTRVIDLTHPIETGMPVPVGFPAVRTERFLDRDRGDVATVEVLHASVHAGTHVDAPAHMLEGGDTVDGLEPLALCGPAVLVDVTHLGSWEPIEAADVVAWERRSGQAIRKRDAVLLHTGHGRHWDKGDVYMTVGWPYVGSTAIDLLLERGVRGIGVECADPDRVDQRDLSSATFECHRRLLGAGVHIIENLARLDEIGVPRFELLALALPVRGASGAAARVLALIR